MSIENKKDNSSQEKINLWKYIFSPVFIRWGYVFAVFVPVILSFLISMIMILTANPEKKLYFAKEPIKVIMRNTIKNGGDLRSIKHIYNTRQLEGLDIQKIFHPNKLNDYYIEDYPLSDILDDLMIDYLQDGINKDSMYYQALSYIIEDNERQNPFDNLEDNQKYNFENIQTKLDSAYIKISPDITKIADELNNKNQLVSKYLSKSEMSFYISIAAVIITIILSLIQITQNFQRRANETVKKADSKEEKDGEEDGT